MAQKNKRVGEDGSYDPFLQGLEEELELLFDEDEFWEDDFLPGNMTFTENGALCYSSSGNALVDYNAMASQMRAARSGVIHEAMRKAYVQDPVKSVKLMFQTGDVRGGKGERNAFNCSFDWVAEKHPQVAAELLELIPEYTRWDNLVRLTVCKNRKVAERATQLVVSQLEKDKKALETGEEISLLAKWMPSLQTKKEEHKVIVRHLLKALQLQERQYRKLLSGLRGHLQVMEKVMSEKNCDSIDMEKMTAKQQLRYGAYLNRVLPEKRREYIRAVLRGEKKMNAGVLNPVEILHAYIRDIYRYEEDWGCPWGIAHKVDCKENEDLEALWKMLPDRTGGNGSTLVIRDGSGSMYRPFGKSSTLLVEAADACAIYCAEHMRGTFHNHFLTFSSRPQLVNLDGCNTLQEKILRLRQYSDATNTDLEATFDLLLDAAVREGLSREELPKYLLILSDMEFDDAREDCSYGCRHRDKKTLFAVIREKWESAGYQMPTLVFWNLNGRRTLFPEVDAENGIIFLSGFSTKEMELVLAGEYEEQIAQESEETDAQGNPAEKAETVSRVLSPLEQVEYKLAKPRYDAVEAAARRGLEKEAV